MAEWFLKGTKAVKWSLLSSFLTCAFLIVAMVLSDSQPAYTLPVPKVMAIPAFARKYGVPCSACHTAWPELNWFGQTFRDNGYQMMKERDSPIWQNPSYWPMTFRMTPNWHRESTNHQPVNAVPGDPTNTVEGTVNTRGFDLSGVDIWTAGTLFKNISFSLLPSSDNTGSFHFENAFVRFDNLLKTRWLNVKFGKFELDNLISEKRFLFLSANGASYQNYHFMPVGEFSFNKFGLGDNQLGVEVSGHSINSYTRYGVAVLSSNDGEVGLPSNRTHDVYLTFSQAFPVGSLGVQRLGVYAYVGQRPTFFQTTSAAPAGPAVTIPGTGMGNKPFYRVGFAGDLFLGKFEFLPFYMRGHDNVFLGTSTPANQPLLPGARGPSWNGGFVETHYYYSPQLVFTQRWEIVRMAQQAFPSTPAAPGAPTIPGNLGNIDAYSVGFRWYPIMFSRAGLAWHSEYSIVLSTGIDPLNSNATTRVRSNSLFIGLDFAF
jgi:hypothetical protein